MDVHVCDDGGYTPEETSEIVAAFDSFIPVKYHYLSPMTEEFRLAAARNLGLREAKAPRVLISDGDCIPPPEIAAAHASYGGQSTVVAGLRDHIPLNIVPMLRTGDVPRAARYVHGHDYRLYHTEYMALAGKPSTTGDWLCWGCHVSYPTEKLCEIGGFDEKFQGWGGEDRDVAIRLLKAGCDIEMRPDLSVYHLDHEPSPHVNSQQGDMLGASRTNPSPVRGKPIRYYGPRNR